MCYLHMTLSSIDSLQTSAYREGQVLAVQQGSSGERRGVRLAPHSLHVIGGHAMGMRRAFLLGSLLFGFPGLLLASDGAIPIWEPTTITQSGQYILTRNVTSASGNAITVNAPDVHIDVHGFTITGDVRVGFTNPAGAFSIEGGKLIGVIGADGDLSSVSVRKMVIMSGGIVVTSFSNHVSVIEGNILHEAWIHLDVDSAVVLNNRIMDSPMEGIDIESCIGCQIDGNSILRAAEVDQRERSLPGQGREQCNSELCW